MRNVLLFMREALFWGARILSRKVSYPFRARKRLTCEKPTVDDHCNFARANRSSHSRDVFTDDGSSWCTMSVVNCHDDRRKRHLASLWFLVLSLLPSQPRGEPCEV